jgi:hypothetical protein
MKNITLALQIVGIIVIVLGLIYSIKIGLEKQEIVDCYKWKNYEAKFVDFELNEKDVARCDLLGIKI